MSLRLAVARDEGLDEATASQVDDRYESSQLPESHKVVLRLADAMMTQPGGISADLRADLGRDLQPEQVIELTLDVMKWNYQKVPVALGTDAEIVPGQLTDLGFDADGNPTF